MFKLKIISLNVNSLVTLQRRHYLNTFLCDNRPDVVLLSETKIKEKHRMSFKNYKFIRTDRTDNKGGGCAILINEKFKFETHKINNLKYIEHCAISMHNELDNKQINIAAIYNSTGRNNIKNDINTICSYFNSGETIIGGDYNAKNTAWGDVKQNESGKSLKEWLDNDGYLNNMVHLPTFKPTREDSFLDFFLISNRLSIKYSNKHPLYLKILPSFSDHAAVELEVINQKMANQEKQTRLDFRNTDIPKYQRIITNGIRQLNLVDDRNLNNEEIINASTQLTNVIKIAIDSAVPKVEIKEGGLLKLNSLTEKLIKTKKTLRRRLYRTGDTNLKPIIKHLDILIKEQINITYNNYWSNKFRSIKMNKDTFGQLKTLVRAQTRPKMPALISENITYENNKDKADVLANYWANIYQQNNSTTDPETIELVNNAINSINNNSPLFYFNTQMNASKTSTVNDNETYNQFIDIQQLDNILKYRNNKLSAGNDYMPMMLLKKIPDSMKNFLVILFNNIYNNAFIPPNWKEAILIPLAKPSKDPQLPASYRMISLLSNISKIYEAFIHQKITEFINENDIYESFQFGFRKNHATTHALSIFTADVATQLNKRSGTIAVSLDTEKAFDTTWQAGIIYKMKRIYHFPQQYCKVIANYLDNRSFRVMVEGKVSNCKQIKAGVPQGSILGPTLFNIYTMDMPSPECNKVKRLIYADDNLMYASCPILRKAQELINKYLDIIEKYTKKWNLKLNIDKCEVMKISNARCYPNSKKLKPIIKFGGHTLNNVKKMKYLGLTISNNFKFNSHVTRILKKCNATLALYNKILNSKCALSPKIKLIFYKQVIRPALAYGFPAWFNIQPSLMEELRKYERKCLRHSTGLHRRNNLKYYRNQDIYNKAKLIRIDNFLIQQALKFASKLELMGNNKIENLLNQRVNLQDDNYHVNHLKLLHREGSLFNNNRIIYYNDAYDDAQYAK